MAHQKGCSPLPVEIAERQEAATGPQRPFTDAEKMANLRELQLCESLAKLRARVVDLEAKIEKLEECRAAESALIQRALDGVEVSAIEVATIWFGCIREGFRLMRKSPQGHVLSREAFIEKVLDHAQDIYLRMAGTCYGDEGSEALR